MAPIPQALSQTIRKTHWHESLFQACANRLSGERYAAPTIVTSVDFRIIVVEQLAAVEISPADILIEPSAKNTAAAICATALALEAREPGADADRTVKDIRRKTRKRYSSEDKIRIVLAVCGLNKPRGASLLRGFTCSPSTLNGQICLFQRWTSNQIVATPAGASCTA